MVEVIRATWKDGRIVPDVPVEEMADLAEWRQKVKEYTIANMHKGIEGLSE
jgi:hypothetical protein